MSDVHGTRDFDEEGFHEIQLSGKQLVFLCMATTVVSIVIFLCGVLVGRGVRPVETIAEAATSPAQADTPVTEPGPAPSAAPPASAMPPAVRGKAADPKPAPSATPATPPPAPKVSDDAKGPSARGDAAKAAAALAPPKAAASHVVAPPATPTPPATPKADAPTTAVPSASAPVAAPNAGAPAPSAPATGGAIAVQVGALRSKADAEALARRLSGKGYATYIVSPEAGAAQVFKVRVGNYGSQDEAERVKRRLQQEEKLQPWITH